MHHTPASKGISLPSIHEMFPEHLTHGPLNHSNLIPQRALQSPISNRPARPLDISSLAGPSRLPPATPENDVAIRPYASSSGLPPSPHMLRSPSIMPMVTSRDPRSRSHDAATKSPPLHAIHTSDGAKHTSSSNCSYNVLRSDPSNSSLEHILTSASYPHKNTNPGQVSRLGMGNGLTPTFRVSVPPVPVAGHLAMHHRQRSSSDVAPDCHMPVFERSRRGSDPSQSYATISFPVEETPGLASTSGSSRTGDSRISDVMDAASDDGEVSGGAAGKKHICPTCSKRFNRPSSLRIHVNTHTGATPFRCPWPNCGREFNVNSNMRRHYRNHTSPGLSRAQPIDPRRRRRRAQETDLVFVSSCSPMQSLDHHSFISPTPDSSISDESEDENHSPLGYPHYHDDPRYSTRSGPLGAGDSFVNGSHTSQTEVFFHNRESHLRASTPMSISSSPPATPLCEHKYSPSAPYLRSSVTDTSVSTALRPAFSAGRTLSEPSLKDERSVNHW
ncbi:hypothetical protein APHAL10511_001485 [Amanita phalloides]|nr:hypothetical protein APHAL10511_001485 [Amanita phalloides]